MIKKPPSKEQLRREIDAQIENYLRKGSEVNQIPRGVSGRTLEDGALQTPGFQGQQNRKDWTYIPEVLDTLEKRKLAKTARHKPASKKKPRKRLLYDDFGEPLRWVWVDE